MLSSTYASSQQRQRPTHIDEGGWDPESYQGCSKWRSHCSCSCSCTELSRRKGDQGGSSVPVCLDLWSHLISRPRKTAKIVIGGTAGESVCMIASRLHTNTTASSLAQSHTQRSLLCGLCQQMYGSHPVQTADSTTTAPHWQFSMVVLQMCFNWLQKYSVD